MKKFIMSIMIIVVFSMFLEKYSVAASANTSFIHANFKTENESEIDSEGSAGAPESSSIYNFNDFGFEVDANWGIVTSENEYYNHISFEVDEDFSINAVAFDENNQDNIVGILNTEFPDENLTWPEQFQKINCYLCGISFPSGENVVERRVDLGNCLDFDEVVYWYIYDMEKYVKGAYFSKNSKALIVAADMTNITSTQDIALSKIMTSIEWNESEGVDEASESSDSNNVYSQYTGSGDDIIEDIAVGDGLYRVHFTNSGRGNFVVYVYDANGSRDLAVNEIGEYDGYYLLLGDAPYMFEITSGGSWSYAIEKIGFTTSVSFQGHGSYVTDMFKADTGIWHITHNGRSNFVVWLITTNGRDLVVNDIGAYEGNKRLTIPSDSNALLIIHADGDWSITPKE